jgi:hypothetical protein
LKKKLKLELGVDFSDGYTKNWFLKVVFLEQYLALLVYIHRKSPNNLLFLCHYEYHMLLDRKPKFITKTKDNFCLAESFFFVKNQQNESNYFFSRRYGGKK